MNLLIDLLPFGFSIFLKIAAHIYDKAVLEKLTKDCPRDYGLTDDQIGTVAGMASDGTFRFSFVFSLLCSLVSALALSYSKKLTGPGIIAAAFFVLGVMCFLMFIFKPLGWLGIRQKVFFYPRPLSRAAVATGVLVLTDIVLAGFTAIPQPAALHAP